MVWNKATGATAKRNTFDTTGFGCTFVAHTVNIQRLVAASCKVEISHGYGNTFNVDLLYTLNTMLKKYQRKKYTAVFVFTSMSDNDAFATTLPRAAGLASTTHLRDRTTSCIVAKNHLYASVHLSVLPTADTRRSRPSLVDRVFKRSPTSSDRVSPSFPSLERFTHLTAARTSERSCVFNRAASRGRGDRSHAAFDRAIGPSAEGDARGGAVRYGEHFRSSA
jgi:hypothetical protein